MTTSELRIGVVGCGRAARVHVGRLKDLDGRLDRRPDRLQSAVAEELLEPVPPGSQRL